MNQSIVKWHRISGRLSNCIILGMMGVVQFFGNSSFADVGDSNDRIDLMAGVFSLSASSTKGTAKVSTLGVYTFVYHHMIFSRIDVTAGYTVFSSSFPIGDLGYGPELGLTYYPTMSGPASAYSSPDITINIKDKYLPFFGITFHQRNFQSIDSSYAGFGVGMGLQIAVGKSFDLKTMTRYMALDGPQKSKASQVDILMGVSIPF